MAIPIIGEVKYQVVTWYPTVNIICKCVQGAMNFLICTGVGAVTHCPVCKDGYSIKRNGLLHARTRCRLMAVSCPFVVGVSWHGDEPLGELALCEELRRSDSALGSPFSAGSFRSSLCRLE